MPENSRFAIAVHALTVLAMYGGEAVKSDVVAGSVNTNPAVIRRLLGALARAGLVAAQTGPSGGAYLAREASKITLGDIYNAVVERQVFALHPRQPNCACPVGRNITKALNTIQARVDGAIDDELGKITLEEFMRTMAPADNAAR